jgi:4-aminobutyrate--pyruvate transaminase
VGAIELAADKAGKCAFDSKAGVGLRAVAFAENAGLIVRFMAGDVISICPPLVISDTEIDELFDRLGRALNQTLDWAKRGGLA